jgi:hypothetical protein
MILRKTDINIYNLSMDLTNSYLHFLSSVEETEEVRKISSSYDICLDFYRVCLGKLLDIKVTEAYVYSESLLNNCIKHLRKDVSISKVVCGGALLQACVLQIGYARRRLGGI